MTKKLDGRKIEEARRQKTQSKRNEYEKQQIRDAFEANKTQKRVVIIPPKPITEVDDIRKTRVCAYCRVSTAEENQAGSFEIQCQHFKQYIENNPMWDFAGIFSDVYNLKMIPFDTINAVQTPKITAFGGKTPVESRYFNFRKLFCLTAGFINAPSK